MSMQPFTQIRGAAAPLMHANIDTDVIIRIEHLAQCARDQLGRVALEALRYLPGGEENPDFILNRQGFRGAPILLAGPNFGCGSSREHAVWALQGMGLRCIIAPSFGDIFHANCFENGLLPIRLPLEIVERLAWDCRAGAPLTVDLRHCVVVPAAGDAIPFSIDPMRRAALLEGLDNIGLSLKHVAGIRAWQDADRQRRPWAWRAVEQE